MSRSLAPESSRCKFTPGRPWRFGIASCGSSRCSMSPVEFVYFDLGNVLARFDPERACRNLQRRWAVEPQQVYQAIWASGLQERLEHGQLTAEEFAAAARQTLGLEQAQVPTEELLDRLCDMFDPIDEMVEVVAAVRESGVPLGI